MKDYQSLGVIDAFFRNEKKEKRSRYLKMFRNISKATRSKNKQKKKKGYKVK